MSANVHEIDIVCTFFNSIKLLLPAQKHKVDIKQLNQPIKNISYAADHYFFKDNNLT